MKIFFYLLFILLKNFPEQSGKNWLNAPISMEKKCIDVFQDS